MALSPLFKSVDGFVFPQSSYSRPQPALVFTIELHSLAHEQADLSHDSPAHCWRLRPVVPNEVEHLPSDLAGVGRHALERQGLNQVHVLTHECLAFLTNGSYPAWCV